MRPSQREARFFMDAIWFFVGFVVEVVIVLALARSSTTPADRVVNSVLFVLLIGMAVTVYILAKSHH